MKWFFPINEGGRDSGFNDAGLETFKGDFDRYLARELIQNSLDERLDLRKPVHVKFELLSLKRDQIPGIGYLKDTFRRCKEYWNDDNKAQAFFAKATQLASQSQITALKVSDFNTKGVPGTDIDRSKNWYSLVRCAGSTSKWGGEGGSFGIGKNAPFAASKLRTVFYSTETTDGDVAFQGVSTLVTHMLPDGLTKAQPTGYFGEAQGESIRTPYDIPDVFRRSGSGLDIIILGFPATKTWQDDLVYSVVDNFWPAIDTGDLMATVGNQVINKSNLPQILETFSGREDFTAHLYYHAYKYSTRSFEHTLPTLKECNLYLEIGDIDFPRNVVMVRKTGMVIYKQGNLRVSPLPFCGVFICRNEEGNRLLREMEPPKHDKWDPNLPTRGANKRTETEYRSFIRDCIKKLAPIDESKVIPIPDLSRFLPDDDDTEDVAFDGSDSRSKNETLERSPLPQAIPGRKIELRQQRMQPGNISIGGEDEETEERDEDSSSSGSGAGSDSGDGGDGNGGTVHGEREASATDESGNSGGANPRPSIPIRYRTFAKDIESGIYLLVVSRQTKGKQPLLLLVLTVGDDQKAPTEIKRAVMADGTEIPIAGPGILGPILLRDDTIYRIDMILTGLTRVAMEVMAIEA